MITKTTTHQSYPQPDATNFLQDDVNRITSALDMIDTDIHDLKTDNTAQMAMQTRINELDSTKADKALVDTLSISLEQVKAVVEKKPPIPVLSSANITRDSFTLSWPKLLEADYYSLDVSTNANFTTFVGDYNNKNLSETSLSISGLQSSTTYYCRIRAVNCVATSLNSAVLTATTLVAFVSYSISFNYTGSLQTWTVPAGVTYVSISANGAEGGKLSNNNVYGGYGAILTGYFAVAPGTVYSVVVGGMGGDGYTTQPGYRSAGGGGGTFVYIGNTLLIAAGGGGGAGTNGSGRAGINASTSTSGTTNPAQNSPGGTNGSGGGTVQYAVGESTDWGGGGGAGWLSNGGSVLYASGGLTKPSWQGGCWGNTITGGYGGGGGSSSGAGGGGGYSGGCGGADGRCIESGGGGGSYNAGTNQSASIGRTGNGLVQIVSVQQ